MRGGRGFRRHGVSVVGWVAERSPSGERSGPTDGAPGRGGGVASTAHVAAVRCSSRRRRRRGAGRAWPGRSSLRLARSRGLRAGRARRSRARRRGRPTTVRTRRWDQAGENAGGEVGAEHVLRAFAGGRARAEALPDRCFALPSNGMARCSRSTGRCRASWWRVFAACERADGVLGDEGSEQEEADRDESLRALLGVLGEPAAAGEAPDHDHRGQAFDHGVQPEPEQRDRAGEDRGGDPDRALGGHLGEAEPGERLRTADQPVTLGRVERALAAGRRSAR